LCEAAGSSPSQLFYFSTATGEIVNGGSGLCLGWDGTSIDVGDNVVLQPCGGDRYVWDESFYKETTVFGPVHGVKGAFGHFCFVLRSFFMLLLSYFWISFSFLLKT
jgi:hypothetical protein